MKFSHTIIVLILAFAAGTQMDYPSTDTAEPVKVVTRASVEAQMNRLAPEILAFRAEQSKKFKTMNQSALWAADLSMDAILD